MKYSTKTGWHAGACWIGLLAFTAAAQAFINPTFTPVDMVKQSDQILLLEFKSVDAKGVAKATVRKVLKGNTTEKEFTLDVMAGPFEDQGKDFAARINGGLKQAVIFIGMFKVEGMGAGGDGEESVGFLHFGDQHSDWRWCSFNKSKGNIWNFDRAQNYLLGTWAGSTESLLSVVNYVQSEPDPYVPSVVGAEWQDKIKIGQFKDKIGTIRPVDLSGSGKPDVFVACGTGDRIFRLNGKSFVDMTDKLALKSASAVYAWGDFNNDQRLDLVSWNGRELSIHHQNADGTFVKKVCDTGAALQNGCLSLSVLDMGGKGHSVILAGTNGTPVLLIPDAGGAVRPEPLVKGPFPLKKPGAGGKCLPADFDKDGIVDVIQLFEQGGLFYKGKARGQFDEPAETQAAAGKGRNAVCMGDFDGDGLMDLFVANEVRCQLWHNTGKGQFLDLLALSGEIAYIAKPEGNDAFVGDVNNDGLQDIFIAYGGCATQLHYNRGFSSFAHGREMDVNDALLPGSEGSQQSACLADFSGAGAEDLALVLANGEAWLLTRKVEGRALSVTAALSCSGTFYGPVNVSAWKDKRCLGTWTVNAGDPGALFGATEAGTITLQWTTPDGKTGKKDVVVKNGPVRVVINK